MVPPRHHYVPLLTPSALCSGALATNGSRHQDTSFPQGQGRGMRRGQEHATTSPQARDHGAATAGFDGGYGFLPGAWLRGTTGHIVASGALSAWRATALLHAQPYHRKPRQNFHYSGG